MYYMERGMWESNMAVAFNFPDYNEAAGEKRKSTLTVSTTFSKIASRIKRFFNFTHQEPGYPLWHE